MSTYELDDELVRRFVDSPMYLDQIGQLRADLRAQLPIPVPTKLGAVVHTDKGIAVLADRNDRPDNSPWVLNTPYDNGGWAYTWAEADEIGRIIEILAPGVDL